MENYRMGQYLPLEVVLVGEPIAYLNFHRQHGSRCGVRGMCGSRINYFPVQK